MQKKEALTEKTKMLELEMLKLKLGPHFLFNTINNIDVLVETDSERAADHIIKLSSILRFHLYKTSDALIKLSDEIKYIVESIILQKIRTSNEHFVKLSISGGPDGEQIAPMIFIPFIENAFKHSQNKKANTIEISLAIHNDEVHFCCRNPFSVNVNQLKGIGSELISSRLKLIYGDSYSLPVIDSGKDFVINLKLPI